jgi:hypothetical protein
MAPVLELLQQSWTLYRRHFGLFGGYAAWLLLPYAGLILIHISGLSETLDLVASLLLLLQAFLFVWVGLLVPLIVRDIVSGKKRIALEPLQEAAWRALPSVVFVAILEMAVVLGGLILFVIPGLIFSVWYMFASLSVILDGTKGMQALAFSREMVRGRFWPSVFAVLGGTFAIFFVFLILANLVIAGVAAVGNVPIEELQSIPPPLWVDVVAYVGEIFVFPLMLVYVTLLYLALRAPRGEKPSTKPAESR